MRTTDDLPLRSGHPHPNPLASNAPARDPINGMAPDVPTLHRSETAQHHRGPALLLRTHLLLESQTKKQLKPMLLHTAGQAYCARGATLAPAILYRRLKVSKRAVLMWTDTSRSAMDGTTSSTRRSIPTC
jgi:hypothetical protein